jgi:hypothetical protein
MGGFLLGLQLVDSSPSSPVETQGSVQSYESSPTGCGGKAKLQPSVQLQLLLTHGGDYRKYFLCTFDFDPTLPSSLPTSTQLRVWEWGTDLATGNPIVTQLATVEPAPVRTYTNQFNGTQEQRDNGEREGTILIIALIVCGLALIGYSYFLRKGLPASGAR